MSLKGRLQIGLMFFILFLTGAFYMQSNHDLALTQRTMTEVSEGLQNGERAPGFSLETLTGEPVNTRDFEGEKIVIFFFTTWCHNCSEQWLQLEWAKKNGFLNNIQIIGVNLTTLESTQHDISDYVSSIPIEGVPILLDKEGEVQELYEIIAVPTSFMIDSNGIIQGRNLGIIPVETIKENDFFSNN
ncbi:peroxiredoxin family protein [Evansella tamaricis]|uniref:TlpA family protein disulfide reductase n=1 Tax=Evansella tamaricis TaxID=2069301 RepID=A0ABS6JHW1_9BACI|nr:TlpA disulfide reductase family protein [Evansella tamaricis]MBU9713269.1 TlpA family protein disulfide reductase [Evansella tamaricis]